MTNVLQRFERSISPSLLDQIHEGLQENKYRRAGFSYQKIFEKTRIATNFIRETQPAVFERLFIETQIRGYAGLDAKFYEIITCIFASNIYQYHHNVLQLPHRRKLLCCSFDEYRDGFKKLKRRDATVVRHLEEIDVLFNQYNEVGLIFQNITDEDDFKEFLSMLKPLFEQSGSYVSEDKYPELRGLFNTLFEKMKSIRSTESAYRLLTEYSMFLNYLSLIHTQPIFLNLFCDYLNILQLFHEENETLVLDRINQIIINQVFDSNNLEYFSLLLKNMQFFDFSSEQIVKIAELILSKCVSIDKCYVEALMENSNWDDTDVYCQFLEELYNTAESNIIDIPDEVKMIFRRYNL